MASLVHLVRHGEVHNPDELVYSDLPGFGLSELGRAQASRTARHLGSQPIVAVWSSPLQRSLETAGIIARRFGVPVFVDDDLTEWLLARRWAGVPWADLPDRFPGELESYLHDPADLPFSTESLRQLAARMRKAVEDIATRHDAGDVVIVSHQDPIQAARLALTGRSLVSLPNDKPDHCTVITLRHRDGWREIGTFTPETIS